MCQSWLYRAAYPPLRKADHLSLAIGNICTVRIAVEYSYKLGQKNKLKFLCVHGWFLQSQSHISMRMNTEHDVIAACG